MPDPVALCFSGGKDSVLALRAFAALRAAGVRHVAFGDIFLEDLREYRERQLAAFGLEGLFPLWRADTASLARAFVEHEFKAVVVCVNPAVLDRSFAGRAFDEVFLTDLPGGVDPCGERGEFHTFVSDGPLFDRPVPYAVGEVVDRAGFVFCDLLALEGSADRAPSPTRQERVQP